MEVTIAMKMMLAKTVEEGIAIIGGADGPTVILVSSLLLPWILALIASALLVLSFALMRRAARKAAHSVTALPEGYREIYSVDLQKNKKMMILINVLALAVTVAMVIPMQLIVPISTLFSMEQGFVSYILRFVALIVGSIVYIVLHELTHAAVMRIYGAKKIRFGFTGMYAFAGSEQDWFDRFSYIQIALAPLVVWGVVLAILQLFVPTEWAWVVYFIQISNVSGAAGDLFVSVRFSRMPSDILVKDTGVSMTVYSAK